MNKEYLVISYYPTPYEGSPRESIEYHDTLESAKAAKIMKDLFNKDRVEELKSTTTIYEAVEIK